MKKIFLIPCVLSAALFFWLFTKVEAADFYEVNLSKDALSRGYPVSWQGFSMLISPQKSPKGSLKIRLETVLKYPAKLDTAGKNKISKIFYYTLEGDTSLLPNRASLALGSATDRHKYLYFYSPAEQIWQTKRYEFYKSKKQIDFLIDKPQGYLVVLESKTKTQRPVKRLDYQSYGKIAAVTALVMDESSNKILLKKKIKRDVPLDDLTHLLTAWTWRRCCQQDWSARLIYKVKNDTPDGFPADPDEPYLYQQVFSLLLIGNTYDNFAYTLAENSGGLDKSKFLQKMKEEAGRLNMKKTLLYDVAGRKSDVYENKTWARDLAFLGEVALRDSTMQWPLKTPYYEFNGITSGHHKIYNTYPLVRYGDHKFHFTVGKTGRVGEFGFGTVIIADDNLQKNAHVVVVVLGHPLGYEQAAREGQKLAEWAFRRWRWIE